MWELFGLDLHGKIWAWSVCGRERGASPSSKWSGLLSPMIWANEATSCFENERVISNVSPILTLTLGCFYHKWIWEKAVERGQIYFKIETKPNQTKPNQTKQNSRTPTKLPFEVAVQAVWNDEQDDNYLLRSLLQLLNLWDQMWRMKLDAPCVLIVMNEAWMEIAWIGEALKWQYRVE